MRLPNKTQGHQGVKHLMPLFDWLQLDSWMSKASTQIQAPREGAPFVQVPSMVIV